MHARRGCASAGVLARAMKFRPANSSRSCLSLSAVAIAALHFCTTGTGVFLGRQSEKTELIAKQLGRPAQGAVAEVRRDLWGLLRSLGLDPRDRGSGNCGTDGKGPHEVLQRWHTCPLS